MMLPTWARFGCHFLRNLVRGIEGQRRLDLKQSTIGDIIESERMLVLSAPERYGAYYTHALDASFF
jgi:hypothetical protein